MNRNQLIEECKDLIREAYRDATEMIVAYLETHDEPRETLCREIDPDNYGALSKRVERSQIKRRSEGVSGSSSTSVPVEVRRAKSDLRKPGVMEAVVADPELNLALAKARQEHDQEARAVGELVDPERRMARHNSGHADDVYRVVKFRNWLMSGSDTRREREWSDDQTAEWVDAMDGVIGAAELGKTDPNFDAQLEEMTG